MPIHVVAGALLDSAGRLLIAQRPPGKHMAGGWEFPGGKLAANETPLEGLIRELREELNIEVRSAQRVVAYTHQYADRAIHLDLWYVTDYVGTPISAEGQSIKWITLDELDETTLLAADAPMVGPLKNVITAKKL